jgi:hypothetical protein
MKNDDWSPELLATVPASALPDDVKAAMRRGLESPKKSRRTDLYDFKGLRHREEIKLLRRMTGENHDPATPIPKHVYDALEHLCLAQNYRGLRNYLPTLNRAALPAPRKFSGPALLRASPPAPQTAAKPARPHRGSHRATGKIAARPR